MQEETIEKDASEQNGFDEELRDILIAISVVAKRLARKIEQQDQVPKEGDRQNG